MGCCQTVMDRSRQYYSYWAVCNQWTGSLDWTTGLAQFCISYVSTGLVCKFQPPITYSMGWSSTAVSEPANVAIAT